MDSTGFRNTNEDQSLDFLESIESSPGNETMAKPSVGQSPTLVQHHLLNIKAFKLNPLIATKNDTTSFKLATSENITAILLLGRSPTIPKAQLLVTTAPAKVTSWIALYQQKRPGFDPTGHVKRIKAKLKRFTRLHHIAQESSDSVLIPEALELAFFTHMITPLSYDKLLHVHHTGLPYLLGSGQLAKVLRGVAQKFKSINGLDIIDGQIYIPYILEAEFLHLVAPNIKAYKDSKQAEKAGFLHNCGDCTERFVDKRGLLNHIRQYHKPCNVTFINATKKVIQRNPDGTLTCPCRKFTGPTASSVALHSAKCLGFAPSVRSGKV